MGANEDGTGQVVTGGRGAACQQYTSVPPLPAPGMHVHRAAQPPQPQQRLEAVQLGAATIKPSSIMIHSDIRAPCREGARFCACMAVVHSWHAGLITTQKLMYSRHVHNKLNIQVLKAALCG